MDINAAEQQSNVLFGKLHEIHIEFYKLWLNNLFTWQWWLALSLIVLPWTFWFLFRKKESTDRLLYAGFFVMVISSSMDMIGIAMSLWSYPINVFPLPELIPFDISALAVATMLLIQFIPTLNPFIKSILFSAFGSFIFLPTISWLGLYNEMGWKNYYSFPILIVIYLLANLIASKNDFVKTDELSVEELEEKIKDHFALLASQK